MKQAQSGFIGLLSGRLFGFLALLLFLALTRLLRLLGLLHSILFPGFLPRLSTGLATFPICLVVLSFLLFLLFARFLGHLECRLLPLRLLGAASNGLRWSLLASNGSETHLEMLRLLPWRLDLFLGCFQHRVIFLGSFREVDQLLDMIAPDIVGRRSVICLRFRVVQKKCLPAHIALVYTLRWNSVLHTFVLHDWLALHDLAQRDLLHLGQRQKLRSGDMIHLFAAEIGKKGGSAR